ncbi:hypothetical protein [Chryseobacterium pennipullorum]|uniref:Uncharacterized protein n=1 Tax=Chryseobacterium pennipullorum TaxID=2258963 RepID=A0A3D9B2W8_9FLAO|nr:hypothetical protein [Chryseobacterium pennipullorum]REC47981.1 hypothetical protein DRF67_08795 [Chryseobacterium pennipullorum]
MKKIPRAKLKTVTGAVASICNGCPTQNHYGPGPEYDGTCENYFALPDYCRTRNCIGVSRLCFGDV